MLSSKVEIKNKQYDFTSISIYTTITVIIIFIEAIIILVNGLKKGIFKKEVLSNKSNLGFDIDIIMKS